MVTVKLVPCYLTWSARKWYKKSRFDESCGKLRRNFRADVRQMSGQSNISTSSATRCSNVSRFEISKNSLTLSSGFQPSWLFSWLAWLLFGSRHQPFSPKMPATWPNSWMARWHDGWCSNYSMNLTARRKNKCKCFLCEVGNLLRELARPTWASPWFQKIINHLPEFRRCIMMIQCVFLVV